MLLIAPLSGLANLYGQVMRTRGAAERFPGLVVQVESGGALGGPTLLLRGPVGAVPFLFVDIGPSSKHLADLLNAQRGPPFVREDALDLAGALIPDESAGEVTRLK